MAYNSAFSNEIQFPSSADTSALVSDTNLPLSALERKQNQIESKLIEKQQTTGWVKGNITGLNDADSLIYEALGNTRSKSNLGYYDAVEIAHKPNEDVKSGIEKSRDRSKVQPQLVARITGKPINQLTNQDYIDVGNMQQIQKLSDLVRSDGQKRWQAPYVPNVEQTNLTGRGYKNPDGSLVDGTGNIPLNIPTLRQTLGVDSYERPLVNTVNPDTMISVTDEATADPILNAAYGQDAFEGTPVGYEVQPQGPIPRAPKELTVGDRAENTVKSVGNEAVKYITEAADAVADLTAVGVQKAVEANGNDIMDILIPASYLGYGIDETTGKLEHKLWNNGKEAAVELSGYKPHLLSKETKAFTGGLQAVVDNEELTDTEKLVEIGKLAYEAKGILPENIVKSFAYLAHILSPKNFALTVAGETNVVLDERNQEHKQLDLQPDNIEDKLGVGLITTGKVGLDRLIDKIIFSGKSVGGETAKLLGLSTKLPDKVAKNTIIRLLKGSLIAAESGTVEFFTEGAQTAMELYAKKFDTDMFEDDTLMANFTPEEIQQIKDGAYIGAYTGVGQSTSGQVVAGAISVPTKRALNTKLKNIKIKQEAKNAKTDAKDTSNLGLTANKEVRDKLKAYGNSLGQMSDKELTITMTEIDNLDFVGDSDAERVALDIKKGIAYKLSNSKVTEEVTFKTKEDAEATIEELYSHAVDPDNETLQENIETIAKTNSISTERLIELKTYAQVEDEASIGPRGYKTMDTRLKRLMVDPKANKARIEKVKAQLMHFEGTQEDRLAVVKARVQEVERKLKDGTPVPKQVRINYPIEGSFTMNIKNGKIAPEVYDIMKGMERTIKGIQKVYEKYNIDLTDESGRYVDRFPKAPEKKKTNSKTKYDKKKSSYDGKEIRKAAKSVIAKLNQGKTVYSDITSKRSAWDKAVMQVLMSRVQKDEKGKNLKDEKGKSIKAYVEVDKDNIQKFGTGRVIKRENLVAKPKEKVKDEDTTTTIAKKVVNGETLTEEEEAYKKNFEGGIVERINDLQFEEETTGPTEADYADENDALVKQLEDEVVADKAFTLHLLDEQEKTAVEEVVAKTITGDTLTPEELQIQQNNKNVIEKRLAQEQKLNDGVLEDSYETRYEDILKASEQVNKFTVELDTLKSQLKTINKDTKISAHAKVQTQSRLRKAIIKMPARIKHAEARVNTLVKESGLQNLLNDIIITQVLNTKKIGILNEKLKKVITTKEKNKLNKEKQEVIKSGLKYRNLKSIILNGNVAKSILDNSDMNGVKASHPDGQGKYPQQLDINKILTQIKNPLSVLANVPYTSFDKDNVLYKLGHDYWASAKKTLSAYKANKNTEQLVTKSSPARALLYSSDFKNAQGVIIPGTINANVVTALGLATEDYIANGASALGTKNVEDIMRMLNKQGFPDKETIEYFRSKGIYTKNMASDIGKATLKNLGLRENPEVSEELFAKLVADLGQMGILLAIDQGSIEFTKDKDGKEGLLENKHNELAFTKGFAKSIAKESTRELRISMVKLTDAGKKGMKDKKLTFKAQADAAGLEDTFKKGALATPSTTKDISVRNMEIISQPKKATSTLNKLRNTKFKPVTKTIEWLHQNSELALKHLGVIPEFEGDGITMTKEFAALSFNDKETARARNEVFTESLNVALDEDLEEMYFEWFYAKSGRYMIDSTQVNPQTDKLHRFLFVLDKQDTTIDLSEGNTKDGKTTKLGLFKFSIAQAFGMSIDKKHTDDVYEFAEKILLLDPDVLLTALSNEKQMEDLGVEVEHLSHYLQGVWALKAYKEANDSGKTSFETNLSMESDAVTSGFGIRLMQMPIIENLHEWLGKTGFFVNKEEVVSMNNEIADPNFKDSYQTLAADVNHKGVRQLIKEDETLTKKISNVDHQIKAQDLFINVLPTVDEAGDVSGALRELFKDPFMTFNYSRGIASIKKGLGDIIADDIIAQIVEPGKKSPEITALTKRLQTIFGKGSAFGTFQTLLQSTSPDKLMSHTRIAKAGKGTRQISLKEYLSTMGANTYGALAGLQLKEKFGPFVKANDIINKSFKAMFQVYNVEYEAKIKEYEKANKQSVTTKEKLTIIKDLRTLFPIIKGPFSTSKQLDDAIAIVATTQKVPEYNYGAAQTKYKENGKEKSKVVQSLIRRFEEAISAGSVTPIHYLDGAMIGNTILDSKGDILGIHDAIIPGLDTLINDVKNYNKEGIETNKVYSMTQAIHDSLSRSVKHSPNALIELLDYEKGKPVIIKVPIKILFEDLTSLNNEVKIGREKLYNQNIDVVHMAAVPGSKYEYRPNGNTKPKQPNQPKKVQTTKAPLKNYGVRRYNSREKVLVSSGSIPEDTIITLKGGQFITVEKSVKMNGGYKTKANLYIKPDDTEIGSDQESTKNTKPLDPTNLRRDALKSVDSMKEIINELDDVNLTKDYKRYIFSLLDSINPKFIPDLNVYINKEAKRNHGMINADNLVININDTKLVKTSEMTATEVYAHELIHAISRYAIYGAKTNSKTRALVTKIERLRDIAEKHITPKDLMAKKPLDKKAELTLAIKRWNYIFKGKNSLHEFVAHGLTNPRLMTMLKNLEATDHNEAKNLWDQILNLFKPLLDWVLGNSTFRATSGTVKAELMQLTFELMESNNKAINELEKREPILGGAAKFLDKYGNKPGAKIIEWVEKKVVGDPNSYTPKPKNGNRLENFVWALKFIPKLLTDEKISGIKEGVLSVFGMKPEGFFQNVLRDFQTPTELERVVEKLGLDSDMIDQARELITKVVREAVYDGFKEKLTDTQKEALTLSGLDLDLQSIYNIYGPTQMQRLLSDPNALKKEISKVTTQLKKMDPKHFKWNTNQAHGLGYYLATHQAGLVQNLNANNIARGVLGTEGTRSASYTLVNKIDQLSTLVGMSYTSQESNTILADLIKTDKKGVDQVMSISKGIIKDSKSKLFKTSVTMIKGYSHQLFDEAVDVRILPVGNNTIGDLNEDGFELVYELTPDTVDNSLRPMGIYKAKHYVNNTYNRTATRMTGMIKRGTTITDIHKQEEGALQIQKAKREIRRIKKLAILEAEKMEKGEYTPIVSNTLTPVLDQYGNVTDYRYTMNKSLKKELMNQDTNIGEVLGRTVSNIQDKVETKKQNDAILEVILADMKKNYNPLSDYGENGKEYIRIEKNSSNKEVQEIYRILPTSMKDAIYNTDLKFIAVRRDMLHNYFGFRDGTFSDFIPLLSDAFKQGMPALDRVIKIAEAMWKDIIAISKVDIIIRTPIVFIGNIVSNFMYSVVMGTNPIKVAKFQYENMKSTVKYINNQEAIAKLRIKTLMGREDKAMLARLEAEQQNNPVHDLMEAGMYQAIVEDIGKKDLKSTNRLARRANEFTLVETVPEFVKQGVNWLYLNENTGYFKFMTQATQYSDFIARATEYQLQREKGVSKKKALLSVLDTFINYGKPATQFEEYLNDMGLVLFTKYMKRIQRALMRSGKEKPANVLLSIIGQETFMPIDDIWDQHLFVRSYTNLDQSFMDHLERAFVPSTLQAIGAVN